MKLLGGRYEALMPLASGGMATVHLGRAIGVGGFERLVAIKLMHPHIANEREFVDMFLDEARLAARIRHPNVVPTLDVQNDDGLFLVMEYVDGPSLQAVRKAWRKQPLPVDVALRIVVDTLAGLHAAHELCDDSGAPLKLVHRDVSPANILIGADGIVRITDFGVARAESRLSSTRGGQIKGKVPYMPPEQLQGQTVDRRCDVYAAGVVLWEQLTGQRLFKADNDGAMLAMILAGPSTAPSALNPEVPAALDAVCMRALERSPAERYATAADFADALEAAAAEAKIALATPRALARFVGESNAHEKVDPQRLAALKQAPLSRPSAPHLAPTSAPGAGSGDAPPPPSAPAASASSGVTSTGAALSAVTETPASRLHLGRVAAAAAAVLGLVGVVFLIMRAGGNVAANGAAAPQATSAAPPQAAPTPAPTASAPPSATAAASAAATASDTASAAPAAAENVKARPGARAASPHPAQPGSVRPPKGPGNAYNPDRL